MEVVWPTNFLTRDSYIHSSNFICRVGVGSCKTSLHDTEMLPLGKPLVFNIFLMVPSNEIHILCDYRQIHMQGFHLGNKSNFEPPVFQLEGQFSLIHGLSHLKISKINQVTAKASGTPACTLSFSICIFCCF